MQKKKVIKKTVSEKHLRSRMDVHINVKQHTISTHDPISTDSTNNKPTNGKEKKIKNKTDDDMNEHTLESVRNILDGQELPEKSVKIEKKEKGLYERTQDSKTLITEDNKIMLTD